MVFARFIVAMERLQLVENIMVVAPWYTVDRHAVIDITSPVDILCSTFRSIYF